MSGRGGTCIERWRNVLFQHGVNWGSHVRVCMWKHEPTGSPHKPISSVCRSGSPIAAPADGQTRLPRRQVSWETVISRCWADDAVLLLGGLLTQLEVGWWEADLAFPLVSFDES